MDNNFDFDVFISFRHVDARRSARYVRRWLQTHTIPKTIPTNVAAPLRIYLDTFQGRVTSDFWQSNILPALQRSRFLLVIASPSASQPLADGAPNWVVREIEAFLKTTQRANIVPILTPENKQGNLPAPILEAFPLIQVVNLGASDRFVPLIPFFENAASLEMQRVLAAVRGVATENIERLFNEARRRAIVGLTTVGALVVSVLAIVLFAGTFALINGVDAAATAAESDFRQSLERSAHKPDEAKLYAAKALDTVTRSWVLSPFLSGYERRIRNSIGLMSLPKSDLRWPGGRIGSIAISADRAFVVVATENRILAAYRTADFAQLFRITLQQEYSPTLEMVASADRIAVTAISESIPYASIFNLQGKPVASRGFAASDQISLLEDGSVLHWSDDGHLHRLSKDTLLPITTFSGPIPAIEAASLAEELRRMTVNARTEIPGTYLQQVFDVETGDRIGQPVTTTQLGPMIIRDRKGTTIFSIAGDGTINRRRVVDGKSFGSAVPTVFGLHAAAAWSSPSGNYLLLERLSETLGNQMEVWDLSEALPRIVGHPIAPVERYAEPSFSPDERMIAISTSQMAHLLSLTTALENTTLVGGENISDFVWSDNGRHLATADHSGRVVVWDVVSARALVVGVRHQEGNTQMAQLGDVLITAGWDGSLRRTPIASPTPAPLEVGAQALDRSHAIVSMTVAQDETRIAIGTHDNKTFVCSLGRTKCDWVHQNRSPVEAAFSGSGQRIVISRRDGKGFQVFDTRDGHLLWRVENAKATASAFGKRIITILQPGPMRALSDAGTLLCQSRQTFRSILLLAPTLRGDRVVALDQSGHATGIDTQTCEVLWKRDVGIQSAMTIVVSDDGRLFAVGGASGGAVFYVEDGEEFGFSFDDRNMISGLAFHPIKPLLLTSGLSRRVNLYDLEKKANVFGPIEFDATPWTVSFDSTGERFAVGLWANSKGQYRTEIMDTMSGKAIGAPIAHPLEVFGVHFLRQSNKLVTTCSDGVLRLWPLQSDERSVDGILHDVARSTGETIDLESGAIRSISVGGRLVTRP